MTIARKPTSTDNFVQGKTDLPFKPSKLETIDFAVYNFVNERIDVHAPTNKGWKKVPVIWVSEERVKQSENDPERRDLVRTIIYPVITVERTGKIKNEKSRGKYYANIPPVKDFKGGSITVARKINQDKTANFQNARSLRKTGAINFPNAAKKDKIVYEWISVPQPVYIQLDYKIKLVGEYEEQMNEMVQPFLTESGAVNGFVISYDQHRYEAFFEEDYAEEDNVAAMEEEPRKYETTVSVRVYGYLQGADLNEEQPFVVRRENAVEFKIKRERVIVGDIDPVTGEKLV